jgi:hypothetical protein
VISPELARRRPDIVELGEVGLPTMVLRAWIFEQVGGFDPTYLHGGDADLLMRARELAPVATLDSTVLRRRIHDDNHSHNVEALRQSTFRVLRDNARRLRAARPEAGPPPEACR